jgi:N-acetylglucosaminyldiphosphoundecaprenol N-acetyl-beta-D-mannosaminyltransferase
LTGSFSCGLGERYPVEPDLVRYDVAAAEVASNFAAGGDSDDLSRDVYGFLGIPLDVLDLGALVKRIDSAVVTRSRFFLSTPNVNFLMMSQVDQQFRESLLLSDSCPVDGAPLVWIARLMGVPLSERASGSDLFDMLRSRQPLHKLKVFLFGGAEGLAETVGQLINGEEGGMACVGALNPGFGSIHQIGADPIINDINASGADFLSVFLSARKAQGFLLENHDRLEVPVRAQLGTTINLQAGIVRRAPKFIQRMGFEWLWRVKEEPYLWRRYFNDGRGLLYLVLTAVLPLSTYRLVRSLRRKDQREPLTILPSRTLSAVRLELVGAASATHVGTAIAGFRQALGAETDIVIDLSRTSTIDARFFGLLLMLRKQLLRNGNRLSFVGLTRGVRRLFRLNGFGFLLD